MNKNQRILFVISVMVECIGIMILTFIVVRKTHRTFSVSPIEKKDIQFPVDTSLTYYYEQTPNTTITESRDWLPKPATHTINSDGLNDRYDYQVTKPTGTYRIITLGDSFTEGMFVDTAENYSERLEDMLNANLHCKNISHFEVINLGVEGFDMQYVLERYKRKGMKYDPDLVVFLTQENDWIEQNESMMALITAYQQQIAATGAGERLSKEVNDPDPGRTLGYREYISSKSYDRGAVIQEQRGYFRQLLSLVPHGFLLFTFQDLPGDIQNVLQQTMEGYPSAYFDPAIPSSYDAVFDGHPSATGHEQFATFLFRYITGHIISCL